MGSSSESQDAGGRRQLHWCPAVSPPELPPHEDRDIQERIEMSLARASEKRVVIATVLNPFPVAVAEVDLLLRSLRCFGGRHASARPRVHVVGEPDQALRARLHELGAEIRVCEPFHERCQTANKLAMLEDIGEADYLLMLDNDIAVADDITPHLVGESIALKPECVDHLGMQRWRMLFAALDLEVPNERVLTTIDNVETIPYYNSGVILVPRALVAPFRQSWATAVRDVLELCTQIPRLAEVEPMVDQMALSVCLARQPLPRRPLPITMNFHTRFAFHPAWQADECKPVLLHHHHALTEDCAGLAPSPHSFPDRVIETVNDALGTGNRRVAQRGRRAFVRRLQSRAR